jgi:hypothetical protein
VENFAQKKFAHTGFERELFVLSSSEFITATVIVQMSACASGSGMTCWARSLGVKKKLLRTAAPKLFYAHGQMAQCQRAASEKRKRFTAKIAKEIAKFANKILQRRGSKDLPQRTRRKTLNAKGREGTWLTLLAKFVPFAV